MASTGQPAFYTHVLDPAENEAVADSDDTDGPEFFVKLHAGDPPATVTFSYRESSYPADCVRSLQETVAVTTSVAARPRFVDDDSDQGQFRMFVEEGCYYGPAGTMTVKIAAGGRQRTLRRKDLCGPWSPGRIVLPGLRVQTVEATRLAEPSLAFHATKDQRYRITVSFAGLVVARRLLILTHAHYPATRVYDGTDGFVNYCINENKRIYPSHLRLYCIDPALTVRNVSFRRL